MNSTLTPAQITDLRASLRTRATVGALVHEAYITYLPADAAFLLVCDGRAMALSADLSALAACLIQERAERGYILRVLDATAPPDEASLDPASRQQAFAQRQASAARIRELERQADEKRRERIRRGLVDVAKLTLDDLM